MKHYLFIPEESYLNGETFSLTQGVIRIQTSNSNSQPIKLEVALRILKFIGRLFSILKTYHSQSNSFHAFFTWTYDFNPFRGSLVRKTS